MAKDKKIDEDEFKEELEDSEVDFDFIEESTSTGDNVDKQTTSKKSLLKKGFAILIVILILLFVVMTAIRKPYTASLEETTTTTTTTSNGQIATTETTKVATSSVQLPIASTETTTQTQSAQTKIQDDFSDLTEAFSKTDKMEPKQGIMMQGPKDKSAPLAAVKDLQKAILQEQKQPSTETATTDLNDTVLARKIAEDLAKFSTQIKHTYDQIANLEQSIDSIKPTLQKIYNHNQIIDNKIAILHENLKILSNSVDTLKRTISEEDLTTTAEIATTEQIPSSQSLVYKGPEYNVHAIIPGRAWLKSNEGQIITVTEGDIIGDYGKVVVIDVANNVVLTSSGVAFK